MSETKLPVKSNAASVTPGPAGSLVQADPPPRRAKLFARRSSSKSKGYGRSSINKNLDGVTRHLLSSSGPFEPGAMVKCYIYRESRQTVRFTVDPSRRGDAKSTVVADSAEVPSPRRRSTLELASDVLANPGAWLRTPNDGLGDRAPIDLIGTEEEPKVYNLLSAAEHGLF